MKKFEVFRLRRIKRILQIILCGVRENNTNVRKMFNDIKNIEIKLPNEY